MGKHDIFTSAKIIIALVTLSLKRYLDVLQYDPHIIGSSSEIFGYLRKSFAIFGNYRNMFGNVSLAFEQLLENLWKSSENHQKSSL